MNTCFLKLFLTTCGLFVVFTQGLFSAPPTGMAWKGPRMEARRDGTLITRTTGNRKNIYIEEVRGRLPSIEGRRDGTLIYRGGREISFTRETKTIDKKISILEFTHGQTPERKIKNPLQEFIDNIPPSERLFGLKQETMNLCFDRGIPLSDMRLYEPQGIEHRREFGDGNISIHLRRNPAPENVFGIAPDLGVQGIKRWDVNSDPVLLPQVLNRMSSPPKSVLGLVPGAGATGITKWNLISYSPIEDAVFKAEKNKESQKMTFNLERISSRVLNRPGDNRQRIERYVANRYNLRIGVDSDKLKEFQNTLRNRRLKELQDPLIIKAENYYIKPGIPIGGQGNLVKAKEDISNDMQYMETKETQFGIMQYVKYDNKPNKNNELIPVEIIGGEKYLRPEIPPREENYPSSRQLRNKEWHEDFINRE